MEQDEVSQINAKLDKIQKELKKIQPSKAWPDRYMPLLTATLTAAFTLIVFFVGYFWKDSVDQALHERQYRLSLGQAVQSHIQTLASTASQEQRVAVAVALAEFGDVAVAPLTRQLRVHVSSHRIAAEEGLRTVALLARSHACDELAHLLDRDRHDYRWWSQASAANLLAELRCPNGAAALEKFEENHVAELRASNTLISSELANLERAVGDARNRLARNQ
jgi:hypothetical protein